MARIPYSDPASLTEPLRNYIELSGNLNLLRMLGHATPGIFEGFNVLSRGIMMESKLDPVLREIAILRVAYASNAAYEIFHHEAIGRAVGLSDAQLIAIKQGGKQSVLNAQQQAVLDFSDDVIRNVRAGDITLNAVREFLDEKGVVDLLLTIGCYMMLARLLETTGVDIDKKTVASSVLKLNS